MSVQASGPIGLTGGCQCGAVRYRVEATPTGTSVCHCRMCQKAGGAPFMAFADVLTEAFVVTRGALATFRSSQIAERGFCAACGTPLTYRLLDGGHTEVTLASFDDPNAIARLDEVLRDRRDSVGIVETAKSYLCITAVDQSIGQRRAAGGAETALGDL